jgi:hypothetical protein
MQGSGDVIYCYLAQLLLVIHLNKHLDSVSLLGRLVVVHGLFFYCTFE